MSNHNDRSLSLCSPQLHTFISGLSGEYDYIKKLALSLSQLSYDRAAIINQFILPAINDKTLIVKVSHHPTNEQRVYELCNNDLLLQ